MKRSIIGMDALELPY